MERASSGAKDQSSPLTPANNTLKSSAKGANTPIGFGLLVTPSSLSSRGTPTTPATLEKKNKKGETALQAAVIKGDETTVRQLLEAGACPNTRDFAGWTPLHEARGRPELVEMLLEAGALPSVPAGDDRMTPLHEAASAGQVEVVRLLVRYGADREARDRMGRTPSQLAQGHAKVLIVLNNEPHVPPPSGVRLQGPPCVVLMKEDPSKLAVKLGCKEMREVGETTTHMVASQDQDDQVQWLAAVIVGAEIVGESWLKEGEVGEEEGHRLEAEGLEISRAWRSGLQPKLFSPLQPKQSCRCWQGWVEQLCSIGSPILSTFPPKKLVCLTTPSLCPLLQRQITSSSTTGRSGSLAGRRTWCTTWLTSRHCPPHGLLPR